MSQGDQTPPVHYGNDCVVQALETRPRMVANKDGGRTQLVKNVASRSGLLQQLTLKQGSYR